MITLLGEHRKQQEAERAAARQSWHEEGWVFASQTGRRLNYRSDHHEWKRLVSAAGLRDARLHDARHTAATVLLILGVPVRTVMSIMGWSSADMATRYQHVTDTIRADVAKQVGGLIWAAGNDDGSHTVTVKRRALASVLRLVEDRLATGDLDPATLADLDAAVRHLRAALSFGGVDEGGRTPSGGGGAPS